MVSLREGLQLKEGGIVSLVGAGGKTSLMFRLARELSQAGETVLTTTTTKIYEPSADQAASVIVTESVSELLTQACDRLKHHRHICAAAGRQPDQGKFIGLQPDVIEQIWNSHLFQWIIVEADGAAGRTLKAPADHEPVIPAGTHHVVGLVGLNGVDQPLTDQWVFRQAHFSQVTGLRPGWAVTASAIADVLIHPKGIFKNSPPAAVRTVFCNQADAAEKLQAGRRIAQILLKRENTGLKRIVIGQALFEPPVLEYYNLDYPQV
jgi:probable selenium-dependent hydroxylase accessory protein YqeC